MRKNMWRKVYQNFRALEFLRRSVSGDRLLVAKHVKLAGLPLVPCENVLLWPSTRLVHAAGERSVITRRVCRERTPPEIVHVTLAVAASIASATAVAPPACLDNAFSFRNKGCTLFSHPLSPFVAFSTIARSLFDLASTCPREVCKINGDRFSLCLGVGSPKNGQPHQPIITYGPDHQLLSR